MLLAFFLVGNAIRSYFWYVFLALSYIFLLKYIVCFLAKVIFIELGYLVYLLLARLKLHILNTLEC